MLKIEPRFRTFLEVLAADRKKYTCRIIGALQQCSRRVEALTLTDFVLGGLSFLGENPQAGLRGYTWQWRLPSRFLVEGIVWILDHLQGENPGS
jgi:hypothetical protein